MLRSGFFNSQNHDRMYNASDFNELISTIKSDGIDNFGDKLEVSAGTGLSVLVSTGKCFFNNHWLYNDNAYQVELEEASLVAPRIDAIVVEVNDNERDVFLKSVSGEPSNNPVPPTLIDSGSVHQHLLAYVNVPKEATTINSITDKRSEWSDVKSDKLDDVQDQITTNIEDGETASRTYNAGEYIVRNNQLYKVTTTIASGSAITEGVNIESATIGNEISAINNNLSNNIIRVTYSLPSHSYTSHSVYVPTIDVTNSIPNGYKLLSAELNLTGAPNIMCYGLDSYPSTNGIWCGFVNLTSESINNIVSKIYLLCVRDI